MLALRRLAVFTGFALSEYIRSGRIVIELIASVLFWGLFLREWTVGLEQFFSLTGVFTLLMAFYTTASLLSIGKRPQGYVLITRPLGRGGYLLGLYLVALLVVLTMYAFVSGLMIFVNPPFDFLWLDFGKGSVPLLLNVTMLASLLVLLAALVPSNMLRLGLTALIGFGVYSQTWHVSSAYAFVEPIQSMFSWPMYPAVEGFKLATSRDWSSGPYIPLIQLALTIIMLVVALLVFQRRDVVLRDQ